MDFWIFLGYTVLLAYICVKADSAAGGQLVSDELRLYQFVVNNQTRLKYVRPVKHANENVHVEISIVLIGLDDLDERRQVLTSHISLRQRWKNPYLSWNPEDFGGLRSIMIPAGVMWNPDVTADNSVPANFYQQPTSQLVANDDGMVTLTKRERLETSCDVDMTYFPLDRHNCSIVFRSPAYDSSQLRLTYSGDPEMDPGRGPAIRNAEWVIRDRSVAEHTTNVGRGSETYDDVTAYVTISRRHSHVIQLYVAPLVMFVLLTSAVFMLPAHSAHKFVLGTGLLISEILLLTSLDDVIPMGHHTPPRLGVYYLCAMVLVSLSLGISALVANMWNRSRRRSCGVPSCIRVVLLKGLSRVLCLYYEDFVCVDTSSDHVCDTYTTSLDTISQGSSASHPLDDAKMIRQYNSHVVHRAEWRQLAAVVDRTFCIAFWAASIIFIVAMAIKL